MTSPPRFVFRRYVRGAGRGQRDFATLGDLLGSPRVSKLLQRFPPALFMVTESVVALTVAAEFSRYSYRSFDTLAVKVRCTSVFQRVSRIFIFLRVSESVSCTSQ